ncbi:hypothetical protein D6855_00475 [Butyrivibrio sp. CB08]|uniref:hypothetical protein n=1 Tax=Butyrivibrio sp. CB08 TaxID=2364879 RepID=UPI000EA8BC71|nr:hypothetical protein [Butyrivibrio sp. CB08]RKM61927.1 hypothetical protein D6855_00475 [Butyrivibrio sp. CB08]
MKKRVVIAALAMAFVMSGCSLNDYNEGLDEANELVSGVVDAVGELANESGALSEIKDNVKDSINEEVTESVKETVREAGKQAAGAVTDSVKDAASKALSDATSKAVTDAASQAVSDVASQALSAAEDSEGGILSSAEDIELTNTDGKGKNYSFKYDGQEYTAIYTTDNWKIKNSYKILSETDQIIICQALIDEHPVHGKDMVSFRTAEDMAYEWQIHNMAYVFIRDDDDLKNHAKDVDFDPEDQGMTMEEFYKSRTGKDLDIGDILGDN